jgi:hypothetical protein
MLWIFAGEMRPFKIFLFQLASVPISFMSFFFKQTLGIIRGIFVDFFELISQPIP